VNFHFVFKKNVFLSTDNDLASSTAILYLYHQISEQFRIGRLRMNEPDTLYLASLILYISFGAAEPSQLPAVQSYLMCEAFPSY
jgi:hypothetical protein